MLAVKTLLSKIDNINTMIFDEIDTGVGGESIKSVADKLADLGKNAQVICVTHSPNIASRANSHFNISKLTEDSRTVTMVNILDKKGRILELTRMLGGSKAAHDHAMSLLS
jgi:DNA repair protein RecN (Recombination protein N)